MFPDENDLSKIAQLLDTHIATEDLKPLASSGLTHDHIIIGTTGWMLRIPRNNQLGLSPEEYLQQQKSCYDAAEKSGVTPSCCGVIHPSADLPNGALVIQYIKGRRINSEQDLPAVARCLASLSSLKPDAGIPLQAAEKPFASQWFVIHDVFGKYFDSPVVDEKVRHLLKKEKDELEKELSLLSSRKDMPIGMIGGDSHLANYLIDDHGKAWFVDLEFLTFDTPAIDAADAISNLTRRLDPQNKFSVSAAARDDFYKIWLENSTAPDQQKPWIDLAERIITLRTLAWMCYWTDQGKADNKPDAASRDNWDKFCAKTLTVQKVEELLSKQNNKSSAVHRISPPPSPK